MHKITEKQRNNLLEAARLIAANPEHFEMSEWLCDTTACIYGWAVIADQRASFKSVVDHYVGQPFGMFDKTAQEAVGFDDTCLYCDEDWYPCDAQEAYERAISQKTRAEAAADYVRWFVEKHTTVEDAK